MIHLPRFFFLNLIFQTYFLEGFLITCFFNQHSILYLCCFLSDIKLVIRNQRSISYLFFLVTRLLISCILDRAHMWYVCYSFSNTNLSISIRTVTQTMTLQYEILLEDIGTCSTSMHQIYIILSLILVVYLCQVPKLLLHRLFPNVRYSLWIDGKLELVVDPYQILERYT